MNILGHAPFIGITGYAKHSRLFFTTLNKYHNVKIRNSTIGANWSGYNNEPHSNETYFIDDMEDMLILQTLTNANGSKTDYPIYNHNDNFKPDVHIILGEMNDEYFYQDYDGFKIAYNVWETTKYPEDFFNRLFYFDQVWVPSKWQRDCLINQGYPSAKIFVVPEGVDVDFFKPKNEIKPKDKFRFLHFGRWDYRKSTTEVLRAFSETFKDVNDVELICSVENPYSFDGLNSTIERFSHHNIDTTKIVDVGFVSDQEYLEYLQNGDVFVSCARSEGWNLPLIEAMSCGTPSIYSNCTGQLEFAEGKGIPIDIIEYKPANIERSHFPGDYAEPNFDDLSKKMLDVYNNYQYHKQKALDESRQIQENFNWDSIALIASSILNNIQKTYKNDFVFVTAGNLEYMPVIEQLVKSLLLFSNRKIIVYGVSCYAPFNYPNMIKKIINPENISKHDKWYWKQYACIESTNEYFENFVWIDGDTIANYNIDNVSKYFDNIENYPIPDIHRQEEFFGSYNGVSQSFNEELCKKYLVKKSRPFAHICFYVYNKKCKWWFDEIIEIYRNNLDEYGKLFIWNDEGIDNFLRWKYNFKKYLPLSNFDTSAYDGDFGNMNSTLNDFLTFWNEPGPKNFNRIYGYQYIPKDKSDIIYFHGNKDCNISERMTTFINMMKNESFYNSEYFYTSIYNIENFGDIKDVHGGTIQIAEKYGWGRAIYHEIYNLQDYYHNRVKRLNKGDIVVDLGANIGVFNRWAYAQGASKVISFEPDKRYYKLLKLNAHPKSHLFNAAMSNKIGEIHLYESNHLGGSNIFVSNTNNVNHYPVRTYNLDYLFETGLVDNIDFLKVDIEGAEILVFDGISDDNLKKINNIAMEYHHSHLGFDEDLRHNFIVRLNNLGFNSHILFLGTNNALQLIHFWK